jgi:drug/metabolite transporter (DMT)-like permease
MNQKAWVHASLFLTALLYGGSYSIAKALMPEWIGASGFILWRVWIATAFFWLIDPFVRKYRELPNKKDMGLLVLCAFFGVAGNMLLFFEGLAISSPINAAVIMVCSPIFILVVAGILKTEKIGWRKLLGIGLGASGAILLILSTADGGPNGQNSPWGNLMILVNALFFATYLVLIRPMMKRYQTFTIVKWLFLFGSLLVLPFGWHQAMAVNWAAFGWQQWSAFIYIIVGISILAYWLNAWSLKHVSSSVVGTYIYLQPVLAALIAVVWAGEKLLVQQIIFALLIFAGVYLVSEAKN